MTPSCKICQWMGEGDRCTNVSSDLYAQDVFRHVACELFEANAPKCRACANAAYSPMDGEYICFRSGAPHESNIVTLLSAPRCFEKKVRMRKAKVIR